MGSLVSRPKRPRPAPPPAVVYAPPPALPPAPAPVAPSPAPSAPAAGDADADAQAAHARVTALLQARRGLPGTVLTGFRGFLDPAAAFPRRKTLLGE